MLKETDDALKYFEVLQRASSFLSKKGLSVYAAEWLMQERLSWSKTELVQHSRETMPAEQVRQYKEDIKEFSSGKPMQQIIGHDWFYGRKFRLNEHTLIPRPETEEWLDRVFKELPNRPLKVLDIGTGTGVLAITHKLERPADEVVAVDISAEALKVARENAERLQADVRFVESDLFEALSDETFDVILSNPPYISRKEIELMDESVLKHEPKQALFAENDGLAIYEGLALDIADYLNDSYCVFLEIGFAQGDQVKKIFQATLPEAAIEIWTDFSDLDRVVAISSKNWG